VKRTPNILWLLIAVMNICLHVSVYADDPDLSNWQAIEDQAQGQTVYFNAFGGETRINRYLTWVASEVKSRYRIDLQHVKIADTAQAVSRVIAEKQAGNDYNGAVDLLWINGENFSALKDNGLLYGPWVELQPNFALVDADKNPEMREDFTITTDGLESPWTRSQLVFYYDSELLKTPPNSIREILAWADENPSEFSYPRPPAFLGSTFLKQALLELAIVKTPLYLPVDDSDFQSVTAPLWKYLDALHPKLLRAGRYFPSGAAELRRSMADSEISLAFSFNPNEAALGIANGELPASTRSYVLQEGTISNVSFVAIPFNAQHKAAAMVVSNFLLSAQAQARGSDPEYLGSTTVLSLERLSIQDQKFFQQLDLGPAAPTNDDLSRKLQEPHPSWMGALEEAWIQRYSAR